MRRVDVMTTVLESGIAPAGKTCARAVARCAGLSIVVGVALVQGCALVTPPEPPRETYDIIAPLAAPTQARTQAQLLVKVPNALKALDSERIVLKPQPRVVTYIAGAQWLDTAPKLVQARLVEAFENTGRTGATAKPGDGLVIDFQLVSDLRRFEIDGARNEAVFEISIKLLTDKTGLVRETRIFTARVPVSGDTPEAYVRALDAAFDAGSKDIIAWVLRLV